MTILDYDRLEKSCPRCGAKGRLIFITDAPEQRPVGATVQNRCKPCAIEEAQNVGEGPAVRNTCEAQALGKAWRTETASPYHRFGMRPAPRARP